MATTVRIDKEHKQKLERFLATHILRRGKKISMQQALGMAIDHALECARFAEKLEKLPPLEEDPAWKMFQNPVRTGIRDLSENIDKYLYGE
ncbi:MAG: hypothetical protein QW567_01385 [Candidatus Hadarchaeales archaeon]